MNCEMRRLVSEYVDGTLTAERRRRVHAHLTQCDSCAQMAEDFRAMGYLLHGLPVAQTSAGFDSRLTERLAQTRRPSSLVAWLRQTAGALWPVPSVLRPAFALSTAILVTAGVVFHPQRLGPINSPPPPQTSANFESPLVTHCVEQHRSYAAVQPLSDIAAQNLATQLDATGSLTSDISVGPEEDNL